MFSTDLGVVFLCLTLSEVKGFDPHHSARMVDGKPANIQDFPFFAGLSDCGAVILSDQWVATTAYCVLNKPTPGRLWVGSESLNNSQIITYDEVVIHPHLNYPYRSNDIALLRLSTPLQFTENIQPVGLPNDKIQLDALVFVSRGYDQSSPTNFGPCCYHLARTRTITRELMMYDLVSVPNYSEIITGELSSAIKKMKIKKLSTRECVRRMPAQAQNSIRPFLHMYEKGFMCGVRLDDQSGLCYQDFGCPLVQGNTLVGIAAGNDNGGSLECAPSKLGFYVNVLNYVPWIKSVTGIQ